MLRTILSSLVPEYGIRGMSSFVEDESSVHVRVCEDSKIAYRLHGVPMHVLEGSLHRGKIGDSTSPRAQQINCQGPELHSRPQHTSYNI